MKSIKVWPHITVFGLLVALLAGLGVAYWLKHEPAASAEELPYAARIQRVDGEVGLNDSLYNSETGQWVAATPNQSFSVGDRIYTRDNSRASLAFTGRNYARLNPNTSLDVLTFDDARTQLALREGSAIFEVGHPGDLFEVATPYGAVDFYEPGLYSVGLDRDNGNAVVSVLSGLAQVVGLAGSGQIGKGEILTLAGTTAAQVLLSRLNNDDAGYLVDDYYRYQYPNDYDGRYVSYDSYLNDPYYYDPYRRNASYQYVTSIIPGVNDLDYYGDWQNVDSYGHVWRPRVDTGWAPYQQGYWVNDYPYGPTWVSTEPWGYAPYHYGRWANVNNQWFWVPEGVNSTPTYSPALVAFVPTNDPNQIGWVALAPGDPYVPRYYDANWQPHYLTNKDLVVSQLVNLAIPGAVAVLPVDQFGRVIDPRSIRRLDQQMLVGVRPVLDPLMLTPLRNAAVHSAWGRGKIDLPPGIAKKLVDTPVVTSFVPPSRGFRKDLAKSMRVETASDNAKKQKLNFKDERQLPAVASDQARKQQIDNLSKEAAKGNKEARQQMHQLQQQQRESEKAARKAAQQPQGERVGNPAQPSQPSTSRGRQDVPKKREPQGRSQAVQQPTHVTSEPPRGRTDVPKAREPQGRQVDHSAGHGAAKAQGAGQGQGAGKAKGKKP